MNKNVDQGTEYNITHLTKFIEAFNNGYNVTEACHYVGISRNTYYYWYNGHPDFAAKVDEAKLMVNRKAKETIVKAIINEDTSTAKWWLERKDPEFKNKTAVESEPDQDRLEDKIREFLDDPANLPNNSSASAGEDTEEA